MKIYDISQEVFDCEVYDGDPKPERKILQNMSMGELYNLTAFSMCAHNGTHIDAPYHFFENGKTVDEIDIGKFIGNCMVVEYKGIIASKEAADILERAKEIKKILIKGKVIISAEAAVVFSKSDIDLIGNESQSVGPEDAPMEVHKILLDAEIVLLEGIRLGNVCEGKYFLFAAPLLLKDSDGAPCRAVLVEN